MIYTKMMDSLKEEEIPQEAAVEQPVEPTVDIEKVTVEEVEDFNDGLVEGAKIDSEIRVESMKFDKSFAILSHVHKYGVDRSFLNICNSDNKLATDLGIVLPASEDFEIYGSPTSNTSKKVIAAMESGDSLWSRFWGWIKGIASKLWNWVKSFFSRAWDFIKKLLGIGTSKLEKISDITQALKKQGVRTIEVDEDFMNIGERLKDSILERQDRMIRNREILNGVKDLVSTSYKYIKDVMTKDNVKKRVEELEAITEKLSGWTSNIWGATKTIASEGAKASDNIIDRIGNSIGDTWDDLTDLGRTFDEQIDRYHKKTIAAQARREYKDAARKKNDELSDWMGSTYERVAKDGTFRNDTRFTYQSQPLTPNPHPIRGQTSQQNPPNNSNGSTQQNPPNNNNGNTQQCPTDVLEKNIRDLFAAMHKVETDTQMQQRIQGEVATMVGDFNTIVQRLNSQNPRTDIVSGSVRNSANAILTILNKINGDLTTAANSGVALNRATLEAYNKQLLALTRFVHNGLSAAKTMLYDSVLRLPNVDVRVADITSANFDPSLFLKTPTNGTSPFDVNRLVETSFNLTNMRNAMAAASWEIHVPIALQRSGIQRVRHLVAQGQLGSMLGQNYRREYYFAFSNRSAAVTIHYYIPAAAMSNTPQTGNRLDLGTIGSGASPALTTVRFI